MGTQPYLAAKERTDSYLTATDLASKQAAGSEDSNNHTNYQNTSSISNTLHQCAVFELRATLT